MVILRAPEPDDLDRLYLWENSSDARRVSIQGTPVSRNQLWNYIQNYTGNLFAGGDLRLMIEDTETQRTVGTIDLSCASMRDLHAEVGVYVAPEYRGRHYGAQAIAALVDISVQNFGLHSLTAIIETDNIASVNLFKTCGFRTCGKLRSWVRKGTKFADAVIFQRLL